MTDSVVLRAADSAGAPAALVQPLPRGTEVAIVERRGAWTKVRVASGTAGWIPEGALQSVVRESSRDDSPALPRRRVPAPVRRARRRADDVQGSAGRRARSAPRSIPKPAASSAIAARSAALGVRDTQETDDGTIVHVLDATPAASAPITGELDWARRRQHMAQHTAQHLLSGTLLERAQAATASARLGETALTIDVTRDRIPDAELAAAEDLANDLVDDDLPVRAWFPSADELAALKLRRDPKVDADIRVVAIGDFDFSPCGGTHCARTAQLGQIRITAPSATKG